MTTFAGRLQRLALCCFVLWLVIPAAHARITAEADRTDMAMGETLRLTLTANEGERPDDVNLTELERDFEILQRSSATSARIVGGEQNVTRTLELELAPKRDGLLAIPALNYSGRRTTPIAIKVNPQPEVQLGDELVYFEASVNQTEVYVQAQLLLTITLQQAINLDNRAISELDIPNTYVEPLEQKSYQRRVSGRLWQVTELRYALFPQQSGTIEIPSVSFSGRELLPGRSLLGARLGRRIALQSQTITIRVKPVPSSFPGDVWLPAKRIELDSQWSSAPEGLIIGDSSTRTIEMTAEGLQGSQLPPLNSLMDGRDQVGLKFYPDKETIEQREISSGIQGYRLQSEALVATTAGAWTLPEVVVPWWNTDTDALEYVRLPAVNVAIAAPGGVPVAPITAPDAEIPTLAQERHGALFAWQSLAAAGWSLALLLAWLLWRARKPLRLTGDAPSPVASISQRSLLALRLACSANDAAAARAALLAWGKERALGAKLGTLDALASSCSAGLAQEIRALDACLWSDQSTAWRGDQLFGLVKAEIDRTQPTVSAALALYPS